MLPSTLFQKKTFTKWVNSKLSSLDNRNYIVNDLETDLRDGHRLLALVRVLVKKTTSVTHLVPEKQNQRIHHIINVGKALKCIEQCTHMPLPNIGSEDIVDGNLKLTLGLIWLLILRFQITQIADLESVSTKIVATETKNKIAESKPSSSTTFEPVPPKEQTTVSSKSENKNIKNTSTNEKAKTSSAAPEKVDVQAQLLQWTQARLTAILPTSNLPKNFNKAWQDGQHFCFLVHGYAPTHLPLHKIKPLNDNKEDWKSNLDLAFNVAEENLGLPKLLDSEDLVNYADEKSIMTYLSGFCELPIPTTPAIRMEVSKTSQIPNFQTQLLQWVKSQLALIDSKPSLPKNFHTSWQNGHYFCYIVHALAPTYLPLSQVRFTNDDNKEDWKYNLQLAFSIAERHLKVCRLLEPGIIDSLVNHVEEKWIIIYLLRLVRVTLKTLVPTNLIEENSKFDQSEDIQLKLLIWIHERLFFIFPRAHLPTDFDASWQNGLYFCLLVYAYAPEYLSITNIRPLDENKENWKHNLDLAFNIAEKHLGVPKLLDSDELVTDAKEERIISYLLRFYHVVLSNSPPACFEECVNLGRTQGSKKTLLQWIHIHIYLTLLDSNMQPITLPLDFDKSWQNGQYFCCLVHYYAPKHLPLHAIRPISNNIEDWKYNLDLALNVAEKHLGIPRVLNFENLANDLNENDIVTYLIKFIEISIRYSFTGTFKISQKITKVTMNFQNIEVQLDLLQWIRTQLQIIQPNSDLPNDFGKAWQNGQYFCFLVKGYAPNQLPFNAIRPLSNNKEDWKHNLDLAFNVALDHLGVPKIVDSGTLINHADEQKIIEYLSRFLKVSSLLCISNQNESKTAIYRNEIKIQLLLWIHTCFSIFQYKLPIPVNFHTSWQNGQYFSFLVHCYAPNQLALGEIKPLNNNKQDWKFNLNLAFETAEKYLGISRLIDSDQLLQNADESKIIDYLFQFRSLPNMLDSLSSTQGFEQYYSLEEKNRLLEFTRTYLSPCIPQSDLPNDFSNSWQDGQLFCFLVHRCEPNYLPLTQLRPKNDNKNDWKYNLDLAFDTAEKHLKISKSLNSDEILKFADENRVISYISQFFQGKILMTTNSAISSSSQLSVDTKRVANSSSDALKPSSLPLDSGLQITACPRSPQVDNLSNSQKSSVSGNVSNNSPASPSASPSKRLSLLPLNIANALGASAPLSALTAYAASFVLPKSPSSADIPSSPSKADSSSSALDRSSSDTATSIFKKESTQNSISGDSTGLNGANGALSTPVVQATIQKKPSLTESFTSYMSSFVAPRQSSILEKAEEDSSFNEPDRSPKEMDMEKSSSTTFSSFSGYFSSLLMPSSVSNTSNEKIKAQKELRNQDATFSNSQPGTLNVKEERNEVNKNIGASNSDEASKSYSMNNSRNSFQKSSEEERLFLQPGALLEKSGERDIDIKTLERITVHEKIVDQVLPFSDFNNISTENNDFNQKDPNAKNIYTGFETSSDRTSIKLFDSYSPALPSLFSSDYQKNTENMTKSDLVEKEQIRGSLSEATPFNETKDAERVIDNYILEPGTINLLPHFEEAKKEGSTPQPHFPISNIGDSSNSIAIKMEKPKESTDSYAGIEAKTVSMSPSGVEQVESTRQESNHYHENDAIPMNKIHHSFNYISRQELPIRGQNATQLPKPHDAASSNLENFKAEAVVQKHQNGIQGIDDKEKLIYRKLEDGKTDEKRHHSEIEDSKQRSVLHRENNIFHANEESKESINQIALQIVQNSTYVKNMNRQSEILSEKNESIDQQSQRQFSLSQEQYDKTHQSLKNETKHRFAVKQSTLTYMRSDSEVEDSSKKYVENLQSSTVLNSEPTESGIYRETLMEPIDSSDIITEVFILDNKNEKSASDNTNYNAHANIFSPNLQIQEISVEIQEKTQLESTESLSKFTVLSGKATQSDCNPKVIQAAAVGSRSESNQTEILVRNALLTESTTSEKLQKEVFTELCVKNNDGDSVISQRKNSLMTKVAQRVITNDEVTLRQEKSSLQKEPQKTSSFGDIQPNANPIGESIKLSDPIDEVQTRNLGEALTITSAENKKENLNYETSLNAQLSLFDQVNSELNKVQIPENKNLDIESLKKNPTGNDSDAKAPNKQNTKQKDIVILEAHFTSDTNHGSLVTKENSHTLSCQNNPLPLRSETVKLNKASNDVPKIEFYEAQSEFKSQPQLVLKVPVECENQKNDLKEKDTSNSLQQQGSFSFQQEKNHEYRNKSSEFLEKDTLEANVAMPNSSLSDAFDVNLEIPVEKQDVRLSTNSKPQGHEKVSLVSKTHYGEIENMKQIKSVGENQNLFKGAEVKGYYDTAYEPEKAKSYDREANNVLKRDPINSTSQLSQVSSSSENLPRKLKMKSLKSEDNSLVEGKEVELGGISYFKQGQSDNKMEENCGTSNVEDSSQIRVADTGVLVLLEREVQFSEDQTPNISNEIQTHNDVVVHESPILKENVNQTAAPPKASSALQQTLEVGLKKERKASLDSSLVQRKPGKEQIRNSVHSLVNKNQRNAKRNEASSSKSKPLGPEIASTLGAKDTALTRNKLENRQIQLDAQQSEEKKKELIINSIPEKLQEEKALKTQNMFSIEKTGVMAPTGVEKELEMNSKAQAKNADAPGLQLDRNIDIIKSHQIQGQSLSNKDSDEERERSTLVKGTVQTETMVQLIQDSSQHNQDALHSLEKEDNNSSKERKSTSNQANAHVAESVSKTKGLTLKSGEKSLAKENDGIHQGIIKDNEMMEGGLLITKIKSEENVIKSSHQSNENESEEAKVRDATLSKHLQNLKGSILKHLKDEPSNSKEQTIYVHPVTTEGQATSTVKTNMDDKALPNRGISQINRSSGSERFLNENNHLLDAVLEPSSLSTFSETKSNKQSKIAKRPRKPKKVTQIPSNSQSSAPMKVAQKVSSSSISGIHEKKSGSVARGLPSELWSLPEQKQVSKEVLEEKNISQALTFTPSNEEVQSKDSNVTHQNSNRVQNSIGIQIGMEQATLQDSTSKVANPDTTNSGASSNMHPLPMRVGDAPIDDKGKKKRIEIGSQGKEGISLLLDTQNNETRASCQSQGGMMLDVKVNLSERGVIRQGATSNSPSSVVESCAQKAVVLYKRPIFGDFSTQTDASTPIREARHSSTTSDPLEQQGHATANANAGKVNQVQEVSVRKPEDEQSVESVSSVIAKQQGASHPSDTTSLPTFVASIEVDAIPLTQRTATQAMNRETIRTKLEASNRPRVQAKASKSGKRASSINSSQSSKGSLSSSLNGLTSSSNVPLSSTFPTSSTTSLSRTFQEAATSSPSSSFASSSTSSPPKSSKKSGKKTHTTNSNAQFLSFNDMHSQRYTSSWSPATSNLMQVSTQEFTTDQIMTLALHHLINEAKLLSSNPASFQVRMELCLRYEHQFDCLLFRAKETSFVSPSFLDSNQEWPQPPKGDLEMLFYQTKKELQHQSQLLMYEQHIHRMMGFMLVVFMAWAFFYLPFLDVDNPCLYRI